MLELGQTVVYRHHVCTVASLRENYYAGKDYYELHALFDNSLKLYVAVEDAVPPALRPTMTRDEALALIDSIPEVEDIDAAALAEGVDTPTLLDRRIKEEYSRRLKTFTPEELLPIMKFAYERSRKREKNGRNATATDKKYFELAEDLLCNELSISLGIDRDDVYDFLTQRIESAMARSKSKQTV